MHLFRAFGHRLSPYTISLTLPPRPLVDMSTDDELRSLTIVVLGNIAGIAAVAAQSCAMDMARLASSNSLHTEKSRMMTLGRIAAKLMEVRFMLEDPPASQQKTISRRLPRLLAQLEVVCSVRIFHTS